MAITTFVLLLDKVGANGKMNNTTKRGLVVKAVGSLYDVLSEEGAHYECRLRGKLRLSGSRSTNPVVVGDWVVFSHDPTKGCVIESIEDRRNCIVRRSVKLSAAMQVIAANLDLAILVYTTYAPPTPLEFVDRFLVTARAYDVPTLLVLNKCDLPEEREAWAALEMEKIYRAAEIELLQVSATTGEGITTLGERIAGKVVLVAGQSGVGKSSILNALDPSLSARVAPLSEQHGLGVHTTTFSEMYELQTLPNTFVIDTPGIKGFGVVAFEKTEVAHFFPEIFSLSHQCKYSNCLHETEPGCAVYAAYEAGKLPESRYRSYLSILYEDKSYR